MGAAFFKGKPPASHDVELTNEGAPQGPQQGTRNEFPPQKETSLEPRLNTKRKTMLSNFLMLAAIKCYGDLGCFRLDGPFRSSVRPMSVAPKPPELINASFLFYSRTRLLVPHVLPWRRKKEALPEDAFGSHRKTKVIVHGFQENGFTKQWIKDLVSELLHHDDFNVIVVDWGNGSSLPYHQAVANTRMVGAVVAQFIKKLQKKYKVTLESFHILGHSLGAHIAGYAGERLNGLGRITGMDPAQPYFQNTHPVVRLDPSDAEFVDVIHTDMKPFMKGGMGTSQMCGHLDFFPNGGRNQPGCDNDVIKAVHITNGDFLQGVRDVLTCRHKRAYIYFTESINSACPFLAVRCHSNNNFRKGECFDCKSIKNRSNCVSMGFHAQRPQRQTRSRFYLKTGLTAPYCTYHQRVTVHLGNSDIMTEKGRLYVKLFHESNATSRRLHFAPREVSFYGNRNVSSVIGTPFTDGFRLLRLQWRPASDMANPFDYFNGVVHSIMVNRITVETLETGYKTTFCPLKPKQRDLLPYKTYEYVPSEACLSRNKRRKLIINNRVEVD